MATSAEKNDILNKVPLGSRHRVVDWTPEQVADYRRRVQIELAGKQENIAYIRKRDSAAGESGFSGDLRRAINCCGKPPQDLGRELGLDGDLVDQFCTGEANLPTGMIDKLVEHLGLRLVRMLS